MRYVIKHPTQGFFTEFKVVDQKEILAPMDLNLHPGHPPVPKGSVIGQEHFYAPQFEAFKPSQAAQFDTQADAEGQIKNLGADGKPDEHMGGAEVFASCTVVESPAAA